MWTEKVTLEFLDDGIDALASYAFEINQKMQNIGARRLYTIMERLLEELSFDAPEQPGKNVFVNAEYVRERIDELCKDEDLSKFIL
jgi:ATP-dependent HslUV protease ATP-binding subunit HslU